MNNESTLTAQQSIDVIEKMIRANNERIERDSAIPFLIWGYIAVITSLLVYFLIPTMGVQANYLWLVIPILGLIVSVAVSSRRSPKGVHGFQLTSRFMNVLWTVLGINCALCSFIGSQYVLTIVTVIIGSGAVVTAFTLGLKSMKITSILGVMLGYLLVFTDLGREDCLVFAAAFFLMFIVPGHYLLLKDRYSHGRKQ